MPASWLLPLSRRRRSIAFYAGLELGEVCQAYRRCNCDEKLGLADDARSLVFELEGRGGRSTIAVEERLVAVEARNRRESRTRWKLLAGVQRRRVRWACSEHGV